MSFNSQKAVSDNYVWDPIALEWVRETQSGGGGGSTDATIVGDNVGLARSAKQDTGNASLASIDSKLANPLPVTTVQIFTLPYDAITVTYPVDTQEVYVSKVGGIAGVIQQTVTINYTDATKALILNVART